MPGKRYRVTVNLHSVAQRLPKGHRIRLSLSSSYFPMPVPPPEPVTLTVYSGSSYLSLSERPPRPEEDGRVTVLNPPEAAPARAAEPMTMPRPSWRIICDMLKDEVIQETITDQGRCGWKRSTSNCSLTPPRSTTASARISPVGTTHTVRGLARGDWDIKV